MREDYPIFVKWMEATDWLLDTIEKFPKTTRFTIASRIGNLTLDVLEGIVEAIYEKQRMPILKRCNMALEKLRVFMRISFNRRYISSKQFEHAAGMIDETGRMIGGWMKVQ